MAQIRPSQLRIGDLLFASSSLYPKDEAEEVIKIERTSMGLEVTTTVETYVYPNDHHLVTIFNEAGPRYFDDVDY